MSLKHIYTKFSNYLSTLRETFCSDRTDKDISCIITTIQVELSAIFIFCVIISSTGLVMQIIVAGNSSDDEAVEIGAHGD